MAIIGLIAITISTNLNDRGPTAKAVGGMSPNLLVWDIANTYPASLTNPQIFDTIAV